MNTNAKFCTHYDCQCTTAQELKWLADTLPGRAELLLMAKEVFNYPVRCRKPDGVMQHSRPVGK